MKNKLLKIFSISIITIFMMCTVVMANQYIPSSISPTLNGNAHNNVNRAAATFIGSLKWIGYAIGIGMIIYVGIKYILAAADEKASLKGMLVKVVIGGLIIVFSTAIVDAVLSLVS